jgi:hypothetical protein
MNCRLHDRRIAIRFLAGARGVLLLHMVETGHGTNSACYSVGTGGLVMGAQLTALLHLVQRLSVRGAVPCTRAVLPVMKDGCMATDVTFV